MVSNGLKNSQHCTPRPRARGGADKKARGTDLVVGEVVLIRKVHADAVTVEGTAVAEGVAAAAHPRVSTAIHLPSEQATTRCTTTAECLLHSSSSLQTREQYGVGSHSLASAPATGLGELDGASGVVELTGSEKITGLDELQVRVCVSVHFDAVGKTKKTALPERTANRPGLEPHHKDKLCQLRRDKMVAAAARYQYNKAQESVHVRK
eukprot:359580-Rhodomonas_salina.6